MCTVRGGDSWEMERKSPSNVEELRNVSGLVTSWASCVWASCVWVVSIGLTCIGERSARAMGRIDEEGLSSGGEYVV